MKVAECALQCVKVALHGVYSMCGLQCVERPRIQESRPIDPIFGPTILGWI